MVGFVSNEFSFEQKRIYSRLIIHHLLIINFVLEIWLCCLFEHNTVDQHRRKHVNEM